jgi:hypothetical protein
VVTASGRNQDRHHKSRELERQEQACHYSDNPRSRANEADQSEHNGWHENKRDRRPSVAFTNNSADVCSVGARCDIFIARSGPGDRNKPSNEQKPESGAKRQ